MIVTERLTINGKSFIRTYSDEARFVVRENVAYAEAIDPADSGRVYTEGDFIDSDEVPAEEALAELVEVLE